MAAGDSDSTDIWIPMSGVYMSAEDLKDGIPSYVKSQLYKSRYVENFSVIKWSRTSRLLIMTNSDKKVSIKDSVFCVVDNGKVRLFKNGKFHDVLVFGRICYFKEYFPRIKSNLTPVVTDTYGRADYILMELKTGNVLKYSLNSIEYLIKDDKELYKEFKSIKKNKQRKSMIYLYIEKYNSRNPLPYTS